MSPADRATQGLTVLTEVVEAFGFLTPMGPAAVLEPAAQERTVSVAYSGAGTGCVVIACGPLLARQLAANLTAADPDAEIPEEDLDQALAELANVVAGNLLVALSGWDHEFRLATPQRGAPRELTAGDPVVGLELMEGVLALAVFPEAG